MICVEYARKTIAQIIEKPVEAVQEISFPLGMRKFKINTLFSFDGFMASLASKASAGKRIVFSSMMPLIVDGEKERYIKRLENFARKKTQNKALRVNEAYDKITKAENKALYLFFEGKLAAKPYAAIFDKQGNCLQVIQNGIGIFEKMDLEEQVETLLNILSIFKEGRTSGCDISSLGGKSHIALFREGSKLSNWMKNYKDVRVIDVSAAGLHEKSSVNLLELL